MTTIVGFEGSLMPGAAGMLAVVVVDGDAYSLIRFGPRVERVALTRQDFDDATQRGLLHRLERAVESDSDSPVLLYLPERPLFRPRSRWDHEWLEEVLHAPGIRNAFFHEGSRVMALSATKAHDLLRLLLEEVLGSLRLGPLRQRWADEPEARLFLRTASAVLKDPNLRERVFALLFAEVSDNELKWNALVRDARREFSDEAVERIKQDAAALRPKPLASAG